MPHHVSALTRAPKRLLGAGAVLVALMAGAPAAQAQPAVAAKLQEQDAAAGDLWSAAGAAVARGALERSAIDAQARLDTLLIAPDDANRSYLVASIEDSTALLARSSGATTSELATSRTRLEAATRLADNAQRVAVAAELDAALAAAQTQLAAWDRVGTDPSRLERLRAAVRAAEGLPATASEQAELNATAELRARTEQLPAIAQGTGATTVGGIVVANKSLALPADYDPGLLPETSDAFAQMQQAAASEDIKLWIDSGYRSYAEQEATYGGWVDLHGTEVADTFSSRPGYSEHQTGLAIDVNLADPDFIGTPEATWLAMHAQEYGFIIRFPEGKEAQTGYNYEPWHLRYVGVELATELTTAGLTLEEYLGITSAY